MACSVLRFFIGGGRGLFFGLGLANILGVPGTQEYSCSLVRVASSRSTDCKSPGGEAVDKISETDSGASCCAGSRKRLVSGASNEQLAGSVGMLSLGMDSLSFYLVSNLQEVRLDRI